MAEESAVVCVGEESCRDSREGTVAMEGGSTAEKGSKQSFEGGGGGTEEEGVVVEEIVVVGSGGKGGGGKEGEGGRGEEGE